MTPLLNFHDLGRVPDLVCYSHLRWNFVYQRPQHLMSRFARETRVFFIEEPIRDAVVADYTDILSTEENRWIVVPHLRKDIPEYETAAACRSLLEQLFANYSIHYYIAWYYTPMALTYSSNTIAALNIYDCMDELSAFKFAPPSLKAMEHILLQRANVVFTGGQSLYNSKRHLHPNAHLFPSSIDKTHFARALNAATEPEDQRLIPYPRMGFFGVLDERFDIPLITALAAMQPTWQFIFIGPTVKIDPDTLPQATNIHYLGMKQYDELPSYIAHWNVALMPFALNESTRFISPTKTPEYLAAGRPVVSTPIHDVVSTYGEQNLVHIARNAPEFVIAIEKSLTQIADPAWQQQVAKVLAQNSWDRTWQEMVHIICEALLQATADDCSKECLASGKCHHAHSSKHSACLPTLSRNYGQELNAQ